MDRFWLGFATGLATGIGASFIAVIIAASSLALLGVK